MLTDDKSNDINVEGSPTPLNIIDAWPWFALSILVASIHLIQL